METQSNDIALGNALANQKRFAAAILCYERAIAAATTARERSECLTGLGDCYLDTKQLDKALNCHKQAIAADPQNYAPRVGKGVAYRLLKRSSEARAAFEKAIEMAPDKPQAYVSLGSLELTQDNVAAAIELSQRAIELDDSLAGGHANLAIALAQAGRCDEAEDSLRKATVRGHLHAAVIHGLIDRKRKGESDPGAEDHADVNHRNNVAAIPYYEYALAAATTAHDRCLFLTAIGNCYKEIRQFDKAIDYHTQAIAADPQYHAPHVNLGIVYNRMGRLVEAKSALQKALEMAPEYAQAHGTLATVLMQMGNRDGGIKHYQRAIELNDSISELHASLAVALTIAGRFEEADQSLERAVERGHQRIAEVQAQMKEWRAKRFPRRTT